MPISRLVLIFNISNQTVTNLFQLIFLHHKEDTLGIY